ncbi:MAG: hypothetical protein ACTHMJ_03645 [Thermomicrobiales bacterium]
MQGGLLHDEQEVVRHIREGRFQRSLALIAGLSSVLSGLEVTYEHYRGSYSQRVLYSPVVLSPALLAAGVAGAFSRRAARTVLPLVSLVTLADGVIGFVFHVRGVARKPGGWRIPVMNVIMGPPVFAPLLFGISGFLGLVAAMLRREDAPRFASLAAPRSAWPRWLPRWLAREEQALEQDVREGRFQRGLAVAAALSALFNGVEALYSHYKNGFTYPSQWIPVVLTPFIMVAGIGTVWSRLVARTLLPVTSLLAVISGGIGFFYHARGVTRQPGGLKLPFYNVMYGPPIFAPLLFVATGFLGLLASLLRRAK